MTITLKEDEYVVTKNGYLRHKDTGRKVKNSDLDKGKGKDKSKNKEE